MRLPRRAVYPALDAGLLAVTDKKIFYKTLNVRYRQCLTKALTPAKYSVRPRIKISL